MSGEKDLKDGPLQKLWDWIRGQMVQQVPADIEVCEFDCRKSNCRFDQYEKCEKRLIQRPTN